MARKSGDQPLSDKQHESHEQHVYNHRPQVEWAKLSIVVPIRYDVHL